MPHLISLFLAGLVLASTALADSAQFPRPAELEPDIRFWTRVYTEIDTRHGFIHDDQYLDVVYETVALPKNSSRRARRRIIDKVKQRYRRILDTLASGKRQGLNKEERRVLNLWGARANAKNLRQARKRLRFQLGQSNKFRAGLIRSGAWRAEVEKILAREGVPVELAVLPHVESSYNPKAFSHVGAAGMWQFTRSTGRRYMRVDHVIDERMDPIKATESAARLLKYNYDIAGTWPLAITAYNHGLAGMRRAKRVLGTSNFVKVARTYKGRTFGFASRNFYVAFLAAVDVDRKARHYFGKLTKNRPDRPRSIRLPDYVSAANLARALGISVKQLKERNPALREAVWRASKHVPKGHALKLPAGVKLARARQALEDLPANQRHRKQKPDRYYRIRRGDSLSRIAGYYKTSISELMAINNLRSRHRIRAGQMLRLPVKGEPLPPLPAASRPMAKQPPPADGVYVVKRGDTLEVIAQRFGVEQGELVDWNKLRSRHRIYPGQRLQLASVIAPPAGSPATPFQTPAAPSVQLAMAEPVKQVIEAPATVAVSADAESPTTEPLGDATEEQDAGPLVTVSDANLGADPSDYSVAGNGSIEVQAAETLGHYADWLQIRTQRLRDLNRLRYGKPVVIGKRIKLNFGTVSKQEFEQKRLNYHRTLQAAYFANREIVGSCRHSFRRGDSLWRLSQRTYNLPIWLLRQYNPDTDFSSNIMPGTSVVIPKLVKKSENGEANRPATETGAVNCRDTA